MSAPADTARLLIRIGAALPLCLLLLTQLPAFDGYELPLLIIALFGPALIGDGIKRTRRSPPAAGTPRTETT